MIARSRLVIGLVAALAVSGLAVSLGAQRASEATDQVRLQFEITKSGALIAKPVLRVKMGQSGSISVEDTSSSSSFSVVPTRTDGNISLQFEFKDGSEPRLVLKGDDGGAELSRDKGNLNIRVTLVK